MKQYIFQLMNALLWLGIFAMFFFMFIKERRSKQSQNKLIESLGSGDYINWFRVKVSRPAYFRRRLKLLGCEGRAVLINTADTIRVVAELDKGQIFDRSYPKTDLNLQWIGNPGLASANMHWISVGSNDDLLMISADTGLYALPSRESTSDMCRMFAPEFKLPGVAKCDFALEKNVASLLLIVMFFVILAYALLDGVIFNDYELINSPRSVKWLFPVIMLCAIPTYFLLVRGKVPSRESLALSVLFVLALELACIPSIKRIDQLLAVDGVQTYDYKLTVGTRFDAVVKGPPTLKFSHVKEYWAQFEPDSIHRFELVHGPLGLWQLKHTALDPKIRAFYDQRDKSEQK